VQVFFLSERSCPEKDRCGLLITGVNATVNLELLLFSNSSVLRFGYIELSFACKGLIVKLSGVQENISNSSSIIYRNLGNISCPGE
jgi:hypothetical protein